MSQSSIVGLVCLLGFAFLLFLIVAGISSRRNGRKTSGFRSSGQTSSADVASFVVLGGFGGGSDCGPVDGGGSCDGGGGAS
jgi:hypothetical protein